MRVWTVANQKGGVGKTTTSAALAGLAAEQGLKVLLIDLDPHGSLTSYFGQDPDSVQLSTFTLFQERKSLTQERVSEVIINTPHEGIELIPSSTALATLERQMIGQDGMGLVIAKALSLQSERFDLAIIDSPPLLGVLMINALAACTQLIIPVQTEFLALKGLERMVHTLEMMAKSRPSPLDYLIVPTMYDKRTHASVSTLTTIRHNHGDQVWPGRISIDTRLRDASKAGVVPHVYDPDSRAVTDYRSLFKRLIKQGSQARDE